MDAERLLAPCVTFYNQQRLHCSRSYIAALFYTLGSGNRRTIIALIQWPPLEFDL